MTDRLTAAVAFISGVFPSSKLSFQLISAPLALANSIIGMLPAVEALIEKYIDVVDVVVK